MGPAHILTWKISSVPSQFRVSFPWPRCPVRQAEPCKFKTLDLFLRFSTKPREATGRCHQKIQTCRAHNPDCSHKNPWSSPSLSLLPLLPGPPAPGGVRWTSLLGVLLTPGPPAMLPLPDRMLRFSAC